MRDAGYIVAGYLLTSAAVGTYAGWLRLRLRRAVRRADQALPHGGAR